MRCNNEIHKEFVEDEYIVCPFCDQEIGERRVKK